MRKQIHVIAAAGLAFADGKANTATHPLGVKGSSAATLTLAGDSKGSGATRTLGL
jgi:hypothetical protein